MRKINQTVTFKDYAGVEKEGIIIEIIGEKYKIKTLNNGIKWVVGEERVLFPELTEEEKEAIEKSQQIKIEKQAKEILQKVEYKIVENKVEEIEVPKIEEVLNDKEKEAYELLQEAKQKQFSKKDTVLFLKSKGVSATMQINKLKTASSAYVYRMYAN